MNRLLLKIYISAILLIFSPVTGMSQEYEFYHLELDWFTIETEHFNVHFHEGAERSARLIAKIGEDIYTPITSFYQYEPDGKIHFIVKDHDDYSNGAAYYLDNKVEIWARPMDFILRGNHNWLRNVVTHEFTHMISLGAARKFTRKIPGIYFQSMAYEPEKNPYVLRGFPNQIISYPVISTIIPYWLAEGVAQFQLPGLNYDTWDSHRDMILRTSVLEDNLLDCKEISAFGDYSLDREKVYNHGYSLVQYIVDNYGLESIQRIVNEMKKPQRLNISSAIKKVINKSEKELYQEWKSYLQEMYAVRTSIIKDHQVAGNVVQDKGTANIFPTWAPDGESYAFLSNPGSQKYSLSMTSLYIYNGKTNHIKRVKSKTSSAMAWSPDGKQLVYARNSDTDKHFSHYNDLYCYHSVTKKEKQLTNALRAEGPDWSKDGKQLVFVTTKDGTQNLAIYNFPDNQVTYLTSYSNGEQVFSPKWSPDNTSIIFTVSRKDNRDIAVIKADGSGLTFILADSADSRDPVFSHDGNTIYFSYDKTGIFNIYSMDINGANQQQLTNVLGGAFFPSVNNKGHLLYTVFEQKKFKIYRLDNPKPIDASKSRYVPYEKNVHLASAYPNETISVMTDDSNGSFTKYEYDDTKIPLYDTKPYQKTYSKMQFFPRVMYDYGTLKLGTYFLSGDVRNLYSVMGGFAINKDRDYDLFGMLNYQTKYAGTLFVEAYNQVLHHSQRDSVIIEDEEIDYREMSDFDFKYNLTEVDIGTQGFLFNESHYLRLAFIYSRYAAKADYFIIDRGDNVETSQNYTYYKGKALSFTYTYRNYLETPFSAMTINPQGRFIAQFKYNREYNDFIDDFKISEYGTQIEEYKDYNCDKFELDARGYLSLYGKHTLDLNLIAGAIVEPVHEFFNFFAGGLIGLRGYPFYSIEGRKLLIGRAAYRFPILDHPNFRFLHLYFSKLYGGVFYDYGNAFNEDTIKLSQFKGNYGLEVRMLVQSFSALQSAVFFNAAYGHKQFVKYENDSTIKLIYGNEWRYYFGVMFGFL